MPIVRRWLRRISFTTQLLTHASTAALGYDAPYFGPGKNGADPPAGFFGTGTVTSRRSPLLLTTLREMLSDAAAMLLATACAVSTGLPAASTMTSPMTISFSWAG